MDTAKYANLPDSLTPDETHSLFKELLATEKPQTIGEGGPSNLKGKE